MTDYKELVADLKDYREENCIYPSTICIKAAEAIERLSQKVADLEWSQEGYIAAGKKLQAENERLSAERDIARSERALLWEELTELEDQYAELKSASAEPVAWYFKSPLGFKKLQPNKPILLNPENHNWTPLYLHPAPAAVQEGWQLVPKEPTEEMLVALDEHGMHYDGCNNSWFVPLKAYHGMLAAAPKPPVQEDAKDAARGRYMLKYGSWYRSEEQTRIAVLVPHGSDLSCYATRVAAIDAAMKEAKK